MLRGVFIAVLVILIGVVAYLSYFMLVNFYSTPSEFAVGYTQSALDINGSVEQFYPNMRFETSEIGYFFSDNCSEEKKHNMLLAMEYLENRTGDIHFYEASSGEIEISCTEDTSETGKLFIAGEGGPTLIINGTLFSVILSGKIILIHSDPCSYNVELHELLHVFGFGHSQNPNSIMYNVTSCKQVLDEDIVSELSRLYSIKSLPDLSFSDVSSVKKGMYINMNFTVRNEGLKDSENVRVALASDSGASETFNLETIKVGEGKVFEVSNFRVPLKTREINLTILDGEEIYTNNNRVSLTT